MNKPVFQKEDFTLCTVPVPQGYPQSQTHAGIFLHNSSWYLTTSPFPTKQYSKLVYYIRLALHKFSKGKLINPKPADRFENPCLYVGKKKQGLPTSFKPIQPFPLMDTPVQPEGGHAYNSDPDIFIEGDTAYILNRTMSCFVDGGKKIYKSQLYLIKGQIADDIISDLVISDFGVWNSSTIVSHSLIKNNGRYYLMYFDTISALDGETFKGLFYKSADSIMGLKDAQEKQIEVLLDKFLPWHFSLFNYNDRMYTIIACVEKGKPKSKLWQMLGVFNNDMSMLTIYNRPLTDYPSYRGAAAVTPTGEFVLYTPIWNEKIKGSKSVDGKDIITASMPMENLLNEIKK